MQEFILLKEVISTLNGHQHVTAPYSQKVDLKKDDTVQFDEPQLINIITKQEFCVGCLSLRNDQVLAISSDVQGNIFVGTVNNPKDIVIKYNKRIMISPYYTRKNMEEIKRLKDFVDNCEEISFTVKPSKTQILSEKFDQQLKKIIQNQNTLQQDLKHCFDLIESLQSQIIQINKQAKMFSEEYYSQAIVDRRDIDNLQNRVTFQTTCIIIIVLVIAFMTIFRK